MAGCVSLSGSPEFFLNDLANAELVKVESEYQVTNMKYYNKTESKSLMFAKYEQNAIDPLQRNKAL